MRCAEFLFWLSAFCFTGGLALVGRYRRRAERQPGAAATPPVHPLTPILLDRPHLEVRRDYAALTHDARLAIVADQGRGLLAVVADPDGEQRVAVAGAVRAIEELARRTRPALAWYAKCVLNEAAFVLFDGGQRSRQQVAIAVLPARGLQLADGDTRRTRPVQVIRRRHARLEAHGCVHRAVLAGTADL